jgi:CheY-like chemotaxis protein
LDKQATNPFRFGALALGAAFTDRQPELRELVAELRPLLVELTGPVVVRRLERIPELRELPLTKEAAVRPEAGERSEPRALTGIRIVIVDDDRDMCDALQYLLESYGAEVTAATSAAEAFAALERSRPDVLLSDVAMPGESGYDLMRKIAAREGGDAPPAVALSSYAKETDRKQAIAAGFRTLVAKPIDPEALVAVVADLAAGRLTKNSGARP